MKFEDKYTPAAENDLKKIEISNEAYAIGEIIQSLIIKLELIRRKFK